MLIAMKSGLAFLSTALVAAGFAFSASPAAAAVSDTFSFPMAKAPHDPALDPALSDPAWQAGKVPSVGGWENVTTRSEATATTVYLLYDDKYLYVGFVVPQENAPITATQTTNDVGFGTDDFVGIGVDPSGAGSQAYFFETTPRGVRYQQALENVRYRPEWQAAAKIEPGGWRAVMIIPLADMRLRPGSSETWRITFVRGVAARGEHQMWSWDPLQQDQGAGNWPSFGDLRYWPATTTVAVSSSATKPKPRLEVYGLSSSGEDRNVYQQGTGPFLPQETRHLGADFSYPVTSTVNLVGTLNPDFSNVETDQQTIAPQEFQRQLTEYRPFFAQGAQYLNPNPVPYNNFNSPANFIFYSPSVGPFDRGFKLEGTQGLQSFGLLSFRGYEESTNDTFDDQAFGYKHAMQDQSFQYWADGVLANHSQTAQLANGEQGPPAHDDTVEAGAKWRNVHTHLVWGFDQAIENGSWVPQGHSHSTTAFVDLHQNNFETNAGYIDIGSNYNPIDGFTTNSDIRGLQGYQSFNGSTPGIKNWSLFIYGDRFFDRSGAVHEADAGAFLSAVFKSGISLNGAGPTASILRGYNGLPISLGAGQPAVISYATSNFFSGYPTYNDPVNVPYNLFQIPIGYHDGTAAPFDVSANWGSFGGYWEHLYTATTSRPLGSKFTLGLEYDGTYQRSLTPAVGVPAGELNSQFLRRISIGYNISPLSNFTVGLRGINGSGGFGTPGLNLAAAYHLQMRSGDLYINYGSPSAIATLNRLIVKYVFRAGGDAGT